MRSSDMLTDIKIPVLGENIESAVLAALRVEAGQSVKKDDILMELETGKAVVEIPAETDGIIRNIRVEEGAELRIGQLVMSLETSGTQVESQDDVKEGPVPESELPESAVIQETAERPPTAEVQRIEVQPESDSLKADGTDQRANEFLLVPAAPSVRRFAREIGIDIRQVTGSGPGGRISIDDVKTFSRLVNQNEQGRPAGKSLLPDFEKWGSVQRIPMSGIRLETAKHLSAAWSEIPMVTQYGKADLSEWERLKDNLGADVAARGGKLTLTALLAAVVAKALVKFPSFNSSIDMEKREIITKEYINMGIAVDTPGGLLVPVIRNIQTLGLMDIVLELQNLAERARERKIRPEDLQGGTFTISNLGGIAGTAFTPLVNSPEVAILGLSRSAVEAVWNGREFEARTMLPLSLSYDHRVIDGADGARFMGWIEEALRQPCRLLL